MKITIDIEDVTTKRGHMRIDGRALTFAHDPGQGGFYITDGAKPHTLNNTPAGEFIRKCVLPQILPGMMAYAHVPDAWAKAAPASKK